MSSPWLTLAAESAFTPASLAETLDGGQAFRWYAQADGIWTGQWGHHVAQLRLGESGRLEGLPLSSDSAATIQALHDYLALDAIAADAETALPRRSDPHIDVAMKAFPGLRILRQPFGETLLGFLCSATKQIVQIKQMLALLADRHGTPLPSTSPLNAPPDVCHITRDKPRRALPTWGQLAALTEDQLRA